MNRYQPRQPPASRGQALKAKETFWGRLFRKLRSLWSASSGFLRNSGFLLATGFVVVMIPIMMQLNLEMFDQMSAEMGMGFPQGMAPN